MGVEVYHSKSTVRITRYSLSLHCVHAFVCMMFQVVLHGGEIREKPRDADEARQFIKGCNNLYGAFFLYGH
jgi:predicted house-cleaning NTP pyrophosphatase (Maf/HAM1 superfamily)